MSSKYRYFDDQPTWSNDYLWPVVVNLLAMVAPPPRSIFELGCGNGSTARMLASRGYSVTGVDPSQSGIAIAKQHESERLRFEIGSTAEDLGVRFGAFPIVLSLEVIEHCPSAQEFMTGFRSVMSAGAVGLISTPYHGYLKNLLVVGSGRFDRHFDPLWEGGHLKFFTIEKLRALFRETGFRTFEFHRVGRIPPLAKSVLAVVWKD